MFGWCGSALVGGVLADAYGYAFTVGRRAEIHGSSTRVEAAELDGSFPRSSPSP